MPAPCSRSTSSDFARRCVQSSSGCFRTPRQKGTNRSRMNRWWLAGVGSSASPTSSIRQPQPHAQIVRLQLTERQRQRVDLIVVLPARESSELVDERRIPGRPHYAYLSDVGLRRRSVCARHFVTRHPLRQIACARNSRPGPPQPAQDHAVTKSSRHTHPTPLHRAPTSEPSAAKPPDVRHHQQILVLLPVERTTQLQSYCPIALEARCQILRPHFLHHRRHRIEDQVSCGRNIAPSGGRSRPIYCAHQFRIRPVSMCHCCAANVSAANFSFSGHNTSPSGRPHGSPSPSEIADNRNTFQVSACSRSNRHNRSS